MARVVFSMTAKESQQEVKVFQKKFRQPALRSLCVKRMCLFISLSRPPSSSSSSSWSISCLLKATSSSTNFIKSKQVGSWKTNSLFWFFSVMGERSCCDCDSPRFWGAGVVWCVWAGSSVEPRWRTPSARTNPTLRGASAPESQASPLETANWCVPDDGEDFWSKVSDKTASSSWLAELWGEVAACGEHP